MDEDQYGMANLRQYMNGRPIFPGVAPPPPPPPLDILSGHRSSLTAASNHHYEMVMVGGQAAAANELLPHHHHHQQGLHHQEFHSDAATSNNIVSTAGGFSGLELLDGGGLGGGGDMGGTGRWPRQETLTLLEIRSRLDSKFKEANQKGPLWDEVSRMMSEEHGYQRSGKKCREKFENLYKYYKKTKEGKAGRQDGKHYRFFRQLEALYGETSSNNNSNAASEPHRLVRTSSFRCSTTAAPPNNDNNNQEPLFHHQAAKHYSDSLSLSNSSDFDTTSSDDSELNIATVMDNDANDPSIGKRKKRSSKRSWKAKIKDFIDGQMRKLMDKQEAWLDKMMRTIENKEQERMLREESWKKQEEARIEKEHKFWAKERAWIEARDTALMEALHRLTGKEITVTAEHRSLIIDQNPNDNGSETITNMAVGGGDSSSWQECEITRLIQLRTMMEARFQHQERLVGCGGEEMMMIWEEIAAKMGSLGYDRSPLMCKEKWESISDYLIKCHKQKGKESSASCGYIQGNNNESIICHHQQVVGGANAAAYCDTNDHHHHHGNCPPNCSSAGQNNISTDNCFRYFMGTVDADNLWDNYGVKLCKGD